MNKTFIINTNIIKKQLHNQAKIEERKEERNAKKKNCRKKIN